MSIGVRVQDRQNQSQKEISHFSISLIQENFFTRTKRLSLIKFTVICYNKGLTIQIINTHKIWMKYFIMIGYILHSLKVPKTSMKSFMLSMLGL